MERESGTLEYKESVTRTFLKTVSAFANYGTGRVVFGITDAGATKGLAHPIEDALRIENMIDDSLDPTPHYAIDINQQDSLVTLTVYEGEDKPYLYQGRAYARQDASTREVGRLELGRLVLEGRGKSFDSLVSSRQDLTFSLLAKELQANLDIEALDDDVKRTLGLLTSNGQYTNAAALLADANDFPGIDMVVFGASINEFRDRTTVVGSSLLAQYEAALEMYERYCVSEIVDGSTRKRIESVPLEAFRETVANALVHRTWDVDSNITVSFFPDRVEVVSPGSLPQGLSRDDYLRGGVSSLRNPLVATVFFRLNIVEKFGTGIRRIRAAYENTGHEPSFEVRSNSVAVALPKRDAAPVVTNDEDKIIASLGRSVLLPRGVVEERTGFSKEKTIRLLKQLEEKGLVVREGKGRGTRYRLS